MQIRIYNTLTHKKEEFIPINKGNISIYSCGPTVYSYAHIGNFRAYIFMDNLRRMFKYNGYKLNHVMNITDVGHLTSDADTGEDKMEKAARKEGKNPYEIAEHYTKAFMEDIESLNIDKPNTITKATDNIKEMMEMVEEIIKNGYGYETSKGIYFDVSKLDKYPVLSNNDVSGEEHGARIDVDPEKKNPYDFAIWIKAPENHLMKWDSPWGLSYPGWHIECSAMGRKFLGEHFDIHTGGVDHIPVHHENEIAQCKGSTGHNPANYWMHCEFLLVDGGKMSKSLGNVYRLSELKEKGVEALAYKLFCYSSHYRNKLNFTFEGVLSSQKALNRLREGYLKNLKSGEDDNSKESANSIETANSRVNTNSENKEDISSNPELQEASLTEKLKSYETRFHEAINDDLNMPVAMGIVWEVIRNEEKSKEIAKLLLKFDEVLGLDLANSEKYLSENKRVELPEEIEELIKKRAEAKSQKNWAEADRIRDEIKAKGYMIKDTANGVEIEKA